MPNNNPLTEVGAIVLAAVLIIIAGLLLYVGKIDTAFATSMFILAGALFAGNLALKAPSPTQQAALLQLTAQALASQAQPAQLVQAPAPVATPQVVQFNPAVSGTTTAPQFVQPAGMIIPPAGLAMPPAIMTTQNMPAVPKP